MRILMTADAVGGVWTYALDLSAALARHDISVVLATMGPRPNDAQRAVAERLGNVQLVESDYRLEWMAEPWADVAAAGEWLLALANSSSADVVHLNGYSHAALPWRRPVVCVAHSCVMSWWEAVHGTSAPTEWNTYKHHVAQGLGSADRVIAPTHAFLQQLRACYEFNRPADVIHNGLASATTFFSSPAPGSEKVEVCTDDVGMLTRHANSGEVASWNGTDPVHAGAASPSGAKLDLLLGCGRLWDPAKNLRVFDDAAKDLPWHSYVIGDATGPDGQMFACSSLRPLGSLPRTEVEAWLRRASIFVHPALYEPFGLAVLEAAAAGCALVLSDIPTLRELWTGAAEFFNPCDSTQLHATLNSLIADSTKRNALAQAARERAAGFRVESTAAAYAKVYQSLVASAPPSRARAVA